MVGTHQPQLSLLLSFTENRLEFFEFADVGDHRTQGQLQEVGYLSLFLGGVVVVTAKEEVHKYEQFTTEVLSGFESIQAV